MRTKLPQELAAWILATQKSAASVSGSRAAIWRPNTRFGSPLAPRISAVFRLRYLARQPCADDKSAGGTFSFDEVAFAVAFPCPAAIFGEGKAGLGRVQLADQAEDLAVEFLLRQRQLRIATDQCAGRRVGREAIEIGIAQDRGALFR